MSTVYTCIRTAAVPVYREGDHTHYFSIFPYVYVCVWLSWVTRGASYVILYTCLLNASMPGERDGPISSVA